MRGKLPDVIKLPPSVTVPFGSFEEALKAKENSDVSKRLEAAIKDIPSSHAEEKLSKCRDIVMEVLHLLLSSIHSFTVLLHGDGFAAACALIFKARARKACRISRDASQPERGVLMVLYICCQMPACNTCGYN